MSPVAVLQVDGRSDKSTVFGDKSKELNMFNSFDKSNVPATCRTRLSCFYMFTALAYRWECACQAGSSAVSVRKLRMRR